MLISILLRPLRRINMRMRCKTLIFKILLLLVNLIDILLLLNHRLRRVHRFRLICPSLLKQRLWFTIVGVYCIDSCCCCCCFVECCDHFGVDECNIVSEPHPSGNAGADRKVISVAIQSSSLKHWRPIGLPLISSAIINIHPKHRL